jgi:hypothetical protein
MDQVLKRPTEPVDAPRHHEVELTKRGIPVELVESRPLLASLPTTDAVVTIDLDDHVTQAIGRGPQFPLLVLGRLVGGADPQIQRRTHGDSPASHCPIYRCMWPKITSFRATRRASSTLLILLMLQCSIAMSLLGRRSVEAPHAMPSILAGSPVSGWMTIDNGF